MGLLNSGGFLSLIFLFVENGLQLPWLSLSFKEQMRTTANQGRSCQEATWGYIKGSREAHQEDWLLFSCSGFSVPGICQVRILEQVVISCSRGSSWPRGWTSISGIFFIGRQILYHCTTWEAKRHPQRGCKRYYLPKIQSHSQRQPNKRKLIPWELTIVSRTAAMNFVHPVLLGNI